MKTTIFLTAILTSACAVDSGAVTPSTPEQRINVVLYAASSDVDDARLTIRPSDYLIDRPFHVTRIGAGSDLDATIQPNAALVIEGTDLVGVDADADEIGIEGWY